MTDDEIDAAIRAVVPAECFRANAGARAIYLAGYWDGIKEAAQAGFGLYLSPDEKQPRDSHPDERCAR